MHDLLHGVIVPDPYRWLEDAGRPDVRAWTNAQDELARAELSSLPERDAIAARLRELLYVDSVSAPMHRGGRYFYLRRRADQEKAAVYWREGRRGAEKVLLDPNAWSIDDNASLGDWQPSWDGTKVAYQVRRNNADEATLYVVDVATGKRSDIDVVEGAKYGVPRWAAGARGFYYTWVPPEGAAPVADRPGFAEVRYHRLGEDAKRDATVRERTGDPKALVRNQISQDGRWLISRVDHGWASNDLYACDLRGAGGGPCPKGFRPIVVGQKAHYWVRFSKDRLYVMTDEGAPRWRVFAVDLERPERASWREIVPERADATLDSFEVVGGRLLLAYLKNASSLLEVRELDGRPVREVKLPGVGTAFALVGRPDDDEAYFSYESFATPKEVYEISAKTGRAALYAKTAAPVDPSGFTTEQVFYPSKDGTRVSMFVVRRKDLPRDGSARALLYGYGGFQENMTPEFFASVYPWLERGGVLAVPNLRGGGEYGEGWHRDGMLLKKQNVFDDFIAAAEHLISQGYTRPSRLAISGTSNGGLLVGAAVTQRPDLFGAALCGVPLLDMVRYHLFGSGKTWIGEYGSADDPDQFRALYAYSPYHRVRGGTKYPAVLLASADGDDRVDPMHARKFAAALQAASAGGPVLLRVERHAGHGGADARKEEVDMNADRYAFALAHTRD